MGFLAMFLITVALFNSIKQPLVIWLNVPLALIGITFGLLALDAPFGFMAILGMLSLSGMIVKNGIVLVDQINLELSEGKSPYKAVYDSSVSRVPRGHQRSVICAPRFHVGTQRTVYIFYYPFVYLVVLTFFYYTNELAYYHVSDLVNPFA